MVPKNHMNYQDQVTAAAAVVVEIDIAKHAISDSLLLVGAHERSIVNINLLESTRSLL